MNNAQWQAIRDHKIELIACLSLTDRSTMIHFKIAEVLNADQYDLINACSLPKERAEKLVHLLQYIEDGWKHLLDYLKKEKYSQIAFNLEQTYDDINTPRRQHTVKPDERQQQERHDMEQFEQQKQPGEEAQQMHQQATVMETTTEKQPMEKEDMKLPLCLQQQQELQEKVMQIDENGNPQQNTREQLEQPKQGPQEVNRKLHELNCSPHSGLTTETDANDLDKKSINEYTALSLTILEWLIKCLENCGLPTLPMAKEEASCFISLGIQCNQTTTLPYCRRFSLHKNDLPKMLREELLRLQIRENIVDQVEFNAMPNGNFNNHTKRFKFDPSEHIWNFEACNVVGLGQGETVFVMAACFVFQLNTNDLNKEKKKNLKSVENLEGYCYYRAMELFLKYIDSGKIKPSSMSIRQKEFLQDPKYF